MFGRLYRLLGAVADWRPRDFLIGMIAAEVVALLAVASLGFGTFAAYTHLAASEGPVRAALVISGAAGVVAIVAGIALARWNAEAPAPEPPPAAAPDDLAVLLKSLTAAGMEQDQEALIAALRLGRDVTPMELLAVSLISGFLAGRKTGS